jgi:competence protein ComEA
MPAFNRAQLGIILLVGAVLFGVFVWRGNFFGTSAAPTAALPTPVFVEVTGRVARPGVYSFPAPPTLLEVCRRAGGPETLSGSDTLLSSGTLVEVDQQGACRLGRMSGERLRTLGVALELNTASAQDLEALPGIGPVLAGRIIQHRETHGPYKTLEDLLAVPGIGKKKLAQLTPFLMVGSAP